MKMNTQRITDQFIRLVSIDSPTYGEKEMGAYLKQCLESLGLSVSQDHAGAAHPYGCGNIYGFLDGDIKGEPILFCAHMDTVEPSRGKQACVNEKGVITSKGNTVLGADDCSGITAILEALRMIHEHKLPHRPIEVLFTVAEEVYCGGIAQLDLTTIKAREAYVLDLTGPVGTAATIAPSILSFTAVVSGKSAHAGFEPQNGIHAVAVAAKAISRLPLGHVDGDTTLNVGVIEGGYAANIVPDRCVVRGEVRSFIHEKALAQVEKVKKHFVSAADDAGATVMFETHCDCRMYETPHDHSVVKRFKRACKVNGLTPVLEKTFGGSDNNYLAEQGIAGIVIAAGMNRCHSCEEFTTVEELCRSTALTLSLMSGSDGGDR